MLNEDASQAGSMGNSAPVARADVDTLPAGSYGPATGNAITGAGTSSGSAGADSAAAPAHIVNVQGAGGPTAEANGNFQANGQYGVLTMDAQGDFNYVRNPGTPDGVRDVFNYTLADASGANSSTTLTIDIGQIAAAAAGQNVINLPAGVQMSDIHVNGRDLVINMPDGTQMVIPNGAVFVPDLVIGDVQVPPTNLATLLIDSEPQPGAGQTQSSGGNFADPVPPLDPGVPLGDLIPPTELTYNPPDFRPIGQFENEKPTVVIEPHDLAPGVVDAVDSVNEKGLPGRDGNLPNEPAGSGEIADGNATNDSDGSEHTFGQIVFTPGDGLQSITIDGLDGNPNNVVTITAASVGTTIQGQFGVLTITSVDLAHGTIGYNYVLSDNTSGDNTADHFTVVVTDTSGDTATATLTVDIIDDVPTARNDTDAITGEDQSTDGNVMTGVGTTSGSAGADTVGADNATVTGVHPGTSGGFTSVPQDGSGVTIHGTFGDLVLHDDGSYTYTRSDIHQGGTDVFTYQLTDGDGDTSTATLTITVPQVNTPPDVRGSDVSVSEEGLNGGNPDTVGNPVDNTNSPTASSAIFVHDADGDPLTVTLGIPSGSFTSGGVPITWALSDSGHTLTGSAGEETIITVHIQDNGNYTVTLSGPVDHPADNGEQVLGITVPVDVSDGIAPPVGTTIGISIEDDSPVVTQADVSVPSLTVDETNLGTDASASFASVFEVSFGGDGPAALNSLVYTLGISASGADSGLVDTATGNHVFLFLEGGEVVGREGSNAGTAAAGPIVFTVSVNSTTGVVTLDQERAVVHPDGTNPDTSEGVTLSSGDLVTLSVTATDYDSDQASRTVNIGQQLTFQDDGPTISAGGEQPSLTVDETNLAVNDSASFAGIFTSSFGADGAGTIAYALGISSSGVDSGLVDTASGNHVFLFLEGGEVVGREGTNAGTAAAGPIVFTVSIDANTGVVTLDQERAVVHPDGTNPDTSEGVTLSADNLVTVLATITDKDGDSSTATANIGQNLNFQDDGPTISAGVEQPSLTVDETNLAVNASASFASVFTSSFGADGAGTIAYALGISSSGVDSGLVDTASGNHVFLFLEGGEVVGREGTNAGTAAGGPIVFTVSVDANTGVVTLDQERAVVHPTASNPDSNEAVTLSADNLVTVTATITDKDGDSSTATANIGQNLNFQDDGPTISASTTQPDLTVDETNLAINASSSFASVFTSSFGADGAGTIAYALNISSSGADSGLVDTASGNHVFLFLEGGEVVGREGTNAGTAAAGPIVFTVSIDSSGNVTLDQIRAVVHPTASNPDSNEAVTLSADNLVTVTATITDKDGDSSTATANIGQNLHFQDDGPTAHSDTNTANEGATVTGNVETNDLFGADGKDAGGGVVGVEAGTHLSDTVTTGVGSPIVGTWGTLTLQADGSYSYHANPNTNPPPGSTDVFTYTIKDGDGDTSTTTLTITVNDVTAAVGSATTIVSEEVLPVVGTERNGDSDSDPTHDVLVNSGNISLTDSLGGATFTTALTAPSGTFTSGGTTIVWTSSNGGHTMTGTAGGNTVIVATIDNTGHYTVTLSGPIDTPNGVNAGENGGDQIIVFGVTATDNLGNTLTPGTLTVHVEDDAPTIDVTKGSDSAVSLTTDDADTIGANTDHATSTANFGGVFGLNFQTGADGTNTTPTLAYTLGVSSPGVDSGLDSHGSSIFLYLIGGVVVGSTATSVGAVTTGNTIFDVSVNSSGQVTLDQFQQIDHPIGSDPTPTGAPFNDQSISMADGLITLTASSSITDKDGDTATDSETVNIGANLHFTDDGPTAAIATTGQAISVDETPGVQADANDVAGPLAAFAGVTNVGTDPNMPAQYASNANAILTTTGTAYGADGPGTTVLSLNVSSAGVDSGLNTTDGHDILLYKEGDLIVGRVSGGADNGKAAFAISIDQTGHLSMVEYLSIQHPNTASADESVSINNGAILGVVNVTDFDGDTATQSVAIGSLISFQDDGPTLGTVQNQQTDNNPATAPAVGTLHFSPGADGAGSTMTITADNTGITSGGHALLTVQTGNVLTAYQDTNNDGIHQVGETTVVYTLTVDPTAGTSGQYVFDLVTPLDPTVTEVAIGGSSSFGAGPTLGQTLTDGATPTAHPLSVVSGYHPTASFDVSAWLAGTALSQSTVTSAGVNGSTSGWGVDNNNFETNNPLSQTNQELMYFDFGAQALSDPDGGGAFTPPSVSLPNITFAKFDFINYKSGAGNAGDDIAYVVHFTDGSFVSGFVPDANIDGTTWQFNAPAGKFIADISFYSGIEPDGTTTQSLGPGKIDLVSVGTTTSSLDVQPSFTVQLTDGDGDPTATAGFNVHIATGLTPFAPAAPVILDLNGDGVHLLGMDAGVHYDYGNGLVATAWASPQDGILAFDANHDGTVTSASEFVFGSNGTSDLQALSAFDTNHDGKLTAADAQFGSFVVWQDANSNGVADAGEVKSLAALGITGISLSSDGISYTTANGDATVVGTGSFTKADGSTGSLADAMFQTGALKAANDDVRSSTVLASNPALIGALAAAGLAALDAGVGNHASFRDFGNGTLDHSTFHTASLGSISTESMSVAETSHVQQSAVVSKVPVEPQHTGTVHDMVETAHALTATSTNDAHSITELLHGTTVPGQGGAATDAHMMAPVVTMPSAAQLAAALTHTGSAQPLNSVAGAQHDEVVGKVLADALHGGAAQGPNVDALLNAMSHAPAAGGNLGLETFASAGSASVPFTHIPGAGAFGGFHSALTVEMVMHADAHPVAAHG